jgi:hypothetical protein
MLSAGDWFLLSNLEDPELHLGAALHAVVLQNRADNITWKCPGVFQKMEDLFRG